MPEIQIQWLDQERQIMKVDYPEGWTWDDYHHNIDRIVDLLSADDNPDPIYFINVYPQGVRLPASAPSTHYRRTVRSIKIGYVVYITHDPILISTLRTFLHSISYRRGLQYDFAGDITEALAIVEAVIAQVQNS
jgi:hypothetical protein